jgi:hypothetical protein
MGHRDLFFLQAAEGQGVFACSDWSSVLFSWEVRKLLEYGEMGWVSRPFVSVSALKRLADIAREAFNDVSLQIAGNPRSAYKTETYRSLRLTRTARLMPSAG